MTPADPSANSDSVPRIRLIETGCGGLWASVVVGWVRALLGAAAAVVVVGDIIDRAAAGETIVTPLILLGVFLFVRALLATVPP